MTTHVVATAGHVDHGKSTLIRALTGMEPDRWEQERVRGLTMDLGFAWTTLSSGREVSFVDVPGHERFIGNAIVGLATAPIVCFVVAADEGWSTQSGEHRDAIAALGIRHGLIVVTKTDRAPDLVAATMARARSEFALTGLRDAPIVAVSVAQGKGLDDLRLTLEQVLTATPDPDRSARLRLWIDRGFSISGAGTVVTGTLASSTLTKGDSLLLTRHGGTPRAVSIRGLESREKAAGVLYPVNRAAINLRGITATEARRGQALIAPDTWHMAAAMDVRRICGVALDAAPAQVIAHIGTAAVPARLRSLGSDHARITLAWPLPLTVGDRLLLRDPGRHLVIGGVNVLDPAPPALLRRGDSRRRTQALAAMPLAGDVQAKVAERGAVAADELQRLGLTDANAVPPPEVHVRGPWWVHQPTYDAWVRQLRALVEEDERRNPLTRGVSEGAVQSVLAPCAAPFIAQLVKDGGLELHEGHIRQPHARLHLGRAEAAVGTLEARLTAQPFNAPLADELTALALGTRELAAAERAQRVLRFPGGVVLLPSAPRQALQRLTQLPQPFTTSQARQALGTSRRVAIPLLEYLDRKGLTRRVDDDHREVRRETPAQ
ncbi:MAG: selenocysteine-specific translation elongation factor [Comamonas sp. SCN 65-56]|uniref:selenocysteine-specific translation elongation factor n=1 Tax=Comamonas sp. SCN 65-56 TaxID=1660095 RepID=UPI000869D864|nr:selenocysteine-specific translation elongation factor [Comamonas sp. SCN 65-56]ODS91046.1 MAG: selenocysteine-specific translation elongation factor [Comamonas sp. SCN 65-56]